MIFVVSAFAKTEFVQSGVKQIARPIAGEGPTGAIGAGYAGREADNQQFGVGIAKARHGGVKPVRLGGAVGVAIGGEARANLAVMRGKGWRAHAAS